MEKHAGNIEDGSSKIIHDVGGITNEQQHQVMATASGEVNPQQPMYQFRTGENGQVTYRVVQVQGSSTVEENQQATLSIVTTNGIQNILTQATGTNSPQVAIVANTFNGENEVASGQASHSDSQGSQKFAYFPSSATAVSSAATEQINTAPENQEQNVTGGQFYVMMSPQEVIPSSQAATRSLVPRSHFVQKMDTGGHAVTVRDSARRIQHNEVERRRRDKINNWIVKLSKLVPDCAGDHTKQGQSKGGILAKTCDYIIDLQTSNQRFAENAKEYERMQLDYEVVRLQLEEKKQENTILRQMLQSHGIEVAITSTANTTR